MGNEIVTIPSRHDYASTVSRAEAEIDGRGLRLVARIDHAVLAAEAGMHLRPTLVLIFGNPKAGTPLMVAAPTLGLDLPLRILVWQDDEGTVYVTYATMSSIAQRHGLGESDPRAGVFDAMLASLAGAITG
ncbi:MAG: DUF302 domain-containing protein [Vulcanimicrobiaceae bacterium]